MAEDIKTIEESSKEKALVDERALIELAKKLNLQTKPYTYIDAVARQGSHIGLPTSRL